MVSHRAGGLLALQTFAPQLMESAENANCQVLEMRQKKVSTLPPNHKWDLGVGERCKGSVATTFSVQLLT